MKCEQTVDNDSVYALPPKRRIQSGHYAAWGLKYFIILWKSIDIKSQNAIG
jgi:hypothetical protein